MSRGSSTSCGQGFLSPCRSCGHPLHIAPPEDFQIRPPKSAPKLFQMDNHPAAGLDGRQLRVHRLQRQSPAGSLAGGRPSVRSVRKRTRIAGRIRTSSPTAAGARRAIESKPPIIRSGIRGFRGLEKKRTNSCLSDGCLGRQLVKDGCRDELPPALRLRPAWTESENTTS